MGSGMAFRRFSSLSARKAPKRRQVLGPVLKRQVLSNRTAPAKFEGLLAGVKETSILQIVNP